jgi:hypothetical protein
LIFAGSLSLVVIDIERDVNLRYSFDRTGIDCVVYVSHGAADSNNLQTENETLVTSYRIKQVFFTEFRDETRGQTKERPADHEQRTKEMLDAKDVKCRCPED